MRTRNWTDKKGASHTSYYYEFPRDSEGKRKLEPLGTDLAKARIRWAEIENVKLTPPKRGTVAYVYKLYMEWANDRETSGLSIRTIKDREQYWKRLNKSFGHLCIDDLQSKWLLTYFRKHSSKASAKKEIKFISVICNWAKAEGEMTAMNPCQGIMLRLKVNERREIYIRDEWFNLVRECGDQVVKDAMDFTYMCGNRPDESVKAKKSDIINNELHISLQKTKASGSRVKRLPLEGELKTFIERQKVRKITGQYILSDEKGQPLSMTGQLRYRFRQAMDKAEKKAKKHGIQFNRFQFRDIRAKAATDTTVRDGLEAARKLLGHTTQKQTSAYVRPIVGEAAKALGKPEMAKVIGLDGESD